MPERLSDHLARGSSRRGFLARVGAAITLLAVGEAAPRAEAYTNFCGHTWTTGNCPHPTGLPRIDRRGLPLRARDGHPVDDLGRPINKAGRAVDSSGRVLRGPDGAPLPKASRTPICDAAASQYGISTTLEGSWYRCCNGRVRKIIDCCSASSRRINGDAALTGYCRGGRRVFCVTYMDTDVPC